LANPSLTIGLPLAWSCVSPTLNKCAGIIDKLKFVGHFRHLSHIIHSLERLILRNTEESVSIDLMDISELRAELERLHGASFGWALSCCRRDPADAEEILQTVYLKILEGKARYRGEASLKTWLFAVIRKTAITEHRRSLIRRLRLIGGSDQLTERNPFDKEPAAAFERSETQKRFQHALDCLPARQREALHLVFYEDLTLREAADVMGVSIGSARTHYERGKKRLRETLKETESVYGVSWRRKENPGTVS
jgi:RNA polymerase sigma-70 factor, ECF subfamily